MSARTLADRVAALEAEVASLRAKVESGKPDNGAWWKKVWGAFAGDPAFEEAMRLGREYRESQRPQAVRRRRKKDADS
jgi:hypothetical protein